MYYISDSQTILLQVQLRCCVERYNICYIIGILNTTEYNHSAEFHSGSFRSLSGARSLVRIRFKVHIDKNTRSTRWNSYIKFDFRRELNSIPWTRQRSIESHARENKSQQFAMGPRIWLWLIHTWNICKIPQ